MHVKILGIKKVKGTHPYTKKYRDGCIIFYSHTDENVLGEKTDSKWVDDKCYKTENIKIGENYNIEFANFFVNKIDVI